MLKLVRRNLLKHPVRSLLTVGSLVIAIFLLCFLRSIVTTLEAGVQDANRGRLWVQSAVSLFVDLPTSYQAKIEDVEGVKRTCKWQWFGAYYQELSNFIAQFACDPEELFEIWPEMEVIAGSREQFLGQRTGLIVGEGLAKEFGWKVGDRIPMLSAIFPKPDQSAWEFDLSAIYRPAKATLDDRTIFFHWDYFAESMEAFTSEPPECGVFVIEVERGANVTEIMATVDALFENGPQVVQTTTEAEFNRQFATMLGNVPRLVGFIGAGVLFAILLACVNTMVLAGREQVHDIGILKALGFTDGAMALLLMIQSLLLCSIGGALGMGLALASQDTLRGLLGRFFPGYVVLDSTLLQAAALTVFVGLLAGALPARNAGRLLSVEALRRGK